jgi:hypothetical protein
VDEVLWGYFEDAFDTGAVSEGVYEGSFMVFLEE